MKVKISILLLVLLFLISCDDKSDIKSYTLEIGNNKVSVDEYTIDGCQYLGYLTNGNAKSCYLTHKGNCNNPMHKRYPY